MRVFGSSFTRAAIGQALLANTLIILIGHFAYAWLIHVDLDHHNATAKRWLIVRFPPRSGFSRNHASNAALALPAQLSNIGENGIKKYAVRPSRYGTSIVTLINLPFAISSEMSSRPNAFVRVMWHTK
jgi:hypothetical protein